MVGKIERERLLYYLSQCLYRTSGSSLTQATPRTVLLSAFVLKKISYLFPEVDGHLIRELTVAFSIIFTNYSTQKKVGMEITCARKILENSTATA